MEELDFIGNMLQPLERAPEEKVILQGRKTSSLFFTVKGQMKVEIEDFTGEKRESPEMLEAKSICGESSYLLRCRRTATVSCTNYCSLL
jgi:hypothetical protein